MKVKKVYKYGTGQIIPEGATYLCTKVEREIFTPNEYFVHDGMSGRLSMTKNVLVWHYFLVEVEDGD
jgi:hypothetical protein